MKYPAQRVYIITGLLLIVGIVSVVVIKSHAKPSYVGAKAILTKPSSEQILQIDQAIVSLPPPLPTGVQANIQITSFATTAAKGTVSYTSNKFLPQLFMAAKYKGKWVVVGRTTRHVLPLPSITTAKKYKLPRNWYSAK